MLATFCSWKSKADSLDANTTRGRGRMGMVREVIEANTQPHGSLSARFRSDSLSGFRHHLSGPQSLPDTALVVRGADGQTSICAHSHVAFSR